MSLARIRTGVKGLDPIIGGGIPVGSMVLVSGPPGTGKTLLALQFVTAAVKAGHTAVYVSFEQGPQELKEQAGQFGWNAQKMERDGSLVFLHMWPHDFDEVTTKLVRLTKQTRKKPDIVVIDSITSVALNHTDTRELIHAAMKRLKEMGFTGIVTSELLEGKDGYSRDGISEFVADGVIVLQAKSLGRGTERTLTVKKLRRTQVDCDIHTLEIGKNGLSVL